MTAFRLTSPWRRTRHWTTLACVTAVLAGLLTLSAGHLMHGWLLILAGLMLAKDTVFGRRSRRPQREHEVAIPQTASAADQKWRKAA